MMCRVIEEDADAMSYDATFNVHSAHRGQTSFGPHCPPDAKELGKKLGSLLRETMGITVFSMVGYLTKIRNDAARQKV